MKLLRNIVRKTLCELAELDFAATIPWESYQTRYEDWEKGVILAWGGLLHLGYHDLPENGNWAPRYKLIDEFKQAWNHRDDEEWFEDWQDWITDMPPRFKDGTILFDKRILTLTFKKIAAKSPVKEPIFIHRGVDDKAHFGGWNSWSAIAPSSNYYDRQHFVSYKILPGAEVIFGHGIADDYEVIANITDLINQGLAEEITDPASSGE